MSRLRVHHSKPVKTWVADWQDPIELFYLPSYSPGLNPEERLNTDLKPAIGSKVPERTKPKLSKASFPAGGVVALGRSLPVDSDRYPFPSHPGDSP